MYIYHKTHGLNSVLEWIDNTLLKIITDNFRHSKKGYKDVEEGFDYFKNTVLTISSVKITNEFKEVFNNLLNGNTILLLEDSSYCFLIESKSAIGRYLSSLKQYSTLKVTSITCIALTTNVKY